MMKYNIQHRQEVNLLIYDILVEKDLFMKKVFSEKNMYNLINENPHQRFGQLLCNYVFPNNKLNIIGYTLFGKYDPFNVESIDTYLKVCKIYNQKPLFEKDDSTFMKTVVENLKNDINDLILQ